MSWTEVVVEVISAEVRLSWSEVVEEVNSADARLSLSSPEGFSVDGGWDTEEAKVEVVVPSQRGSSDSGARPERC